MWCDECKYWDQNAADCELNGLKIGLCTKAKAIWDVTDWDRSGVGEYGQRVLLPEFADLKLFAQDGSDYKAEVLTMADFYCAHFRLMQSHP